MTISQVCLLVFALHRHPDYPLIVAANRDEFYARPSSAACYWADHPQVFAGRDLEKGGTWLGVTTDGRFAALTNYRDPASRKHNPESRGRLVSSFLTNDIDAASFLAKVERDANHYDGFNLIVGDRQGLHYFSNRGGRPRKLSSDIYGVSNHLLNTPWPKLMQARLKFQTIVQSPLPKTREMFNLLADRNPATDDQLPDTGVGLEWERKLSSIFIASADYGTRASTVVMFHRDGWIHFHERTFRETGIFFSETSETLAHP